MATATVQADLGDYDDKCLRQVEIQRSHLEWQVSRYRSGMHFTSESLPQGLKTSAATAA